MLAEMDPFRHRDVVWIFTERSGPATAMTLHLWSGVRAVVRTTLSETQPRPTETQSRSTP